MMPHAMTARPVENHNPYLARFNALEKQAGRTALRWVLPLRKAGISYFAELGFPSAQHEEWRFTNLSPITRLQPVFELHAEGVPGRDLERFSFGGMNCIRRVFVDGHLAPELSSPGDVADGLQVRSLAAVDQADVAGLSSHLGRHARCDDNAFVALNTALFEDGGVIAVPAGRVIKEPIHLLFVSTGQQAGGAVHPRNLVLLGDHAQATLVESYVSLGDAPTLTNAVTEIVLAEGAFLEHCKLQSESPKAFHVATVQVRLAGNSRFVNHSLSTGGRIARHNINVMLAGEGIDCMLNGLYVADGEQLVDHHTVVDHTRPHCSSHEFYHGILGGRSRGVFNGKILVRKDAQKTDAKQTNRNLLLSEDATINTKPQLEIFADDVKCTHGATVGQLDEEAIFYLRSRGIGRETARQMLVHAFASDVINRLSWEPIRAELERIVSGRLDRPGGKDG